VSKLNCKIIPFEELNTKELYEILSLRSEVFVVEQDCVYQDIDFKDQQAIHICGYQGGELVAYTRVFGPGEYFDESSIGRVLVKMSHRKKDFGIQIMQCSIRYTERNFKGQNIKISAQSYLERFYNSLGFLATGKAYLEDGIPHMEMIKTI
jgi:ElaA protein